MAGQSGLEIGDPRRGGHRSLQLHVMDRPLVSPCRNLCSLDRERKICTGCGRTIEEIVHWRSMTEAARAAVMARVRDFEPETRPSA
ncbi:DUF1289 domain-containing protein [Sphingobium sp. CR2-8]|uniref:DUF1289 domain-containing protein n=1 Tax=Sphingobium sp. CR2-8 TaxID=1306534 RepID=UPI002DBFCD9E|nr:DUF1289 domain-containing protein [Sphingobium sp. CR2-8]MEC3910621.1 DUF1289 domain-containing protein [Sphingobium sp. CR2-8]